jgi:divalent metal cation (Fe/Co/Zn/Cd) transporter
MNSSRSTASASAARSARPPWSPTDCTLAPTDSPRWPLLFGAGGVALGFPLADPIVGLLITVAILAYLRTAVRVVFRRLMDAVDPELVDTAEAALAAEPGVKAVRSIKMRWIGHRLHADAELDIDRATSLTEAHRIAHDTEHTLTHAVPKLSTALIHAYPANHNTPATP